MTLTQEEIDKRISDSYEVPNNVVNAVPKPMVTVRTSTYQHGLYIKDCIEGVLMQKTEFPIEFVIGEDFSTDGTREIVFDYAEKYPDIIRVITADYNVGSKANGGRCKRAARGKYMATCEGDDYWTDPLKLQKQVDFMEENAELSGCFHACKIEYQDSQREKIIRDKVKNIFDLGYYLERDIFATTGSLLYKRKISNTPKWTNNIFAGDFVIKYFILVDGNMGYIDDVMGVYRKGVPGSWSKQELTQKKIDQEFSDNIYVLTKINELSDYKYSYQVYSKMKRLYVIYISRSMVGRSLTEKFKLIFSNLLFLNKQTLKILIKRHLEKHGIYR